MLFPARFLQGVCNRLGFLDTLWVMNLLNTKRK